MNIALIGYGKMGKEIEKVAISRGHAIKLIIDISNPEDLNPEKLKDVDVAIGFTRPESAYDNYMKCFDAGVPVVSGTTGWLDKFETVKKMCEEDNKGFFYASNFSLGVNLFFKLNKMLAKLMNPFKEYNVEMEEIHHTQKLDAPSGTAITLAEGVIENYDSKSDWSLEESKNESDVVITAKRIGEVPGTHSIKYDSEVDYINITHCAKSRAGFVLGAVMAAEYMNGKTGLHSMEDMLT